MSQPLVLSTDWHTHTSRTDGRSSAAEMIAAATDKGMTRLHITDHVRADTTWLPEYVADLQALRDSGPLDVVIGVEAKMLDVRGALDTPTNLSGIEQLIVADHQFPTRSGPVTPDEMRRRIESGRVRGSDVVEDLVLATSRAVFAHERTVVGHIFSVLPKAGLSPDLVTGEMLDTLASAVRQAGAVIEVNEKWRTPSVELIGALCARGVELVPSSDAHDADSVGAWDFVAQGALAIAP